MANDQSARPWPTSGLPPLLPPGWGVYLRGYVDRYGNPDDVSCMAPSLQAAEAYRAPMPGAAQFQPHRQMELACAQTARAAVITTSLFEGLDPEVLEAAFSNSLSHLRQEATDYAKNDLPGLAKDMTEQVDAMLQFGIRLGFRINGKG